VSKLISLQPKDTQDKRGVWIWAVFWVLCVPFIVFAYMKLCELAAEIKEINRARMAGNQAHVQPRDRIRAASGLLWVTSIARIVYMVVGNSWPMVAIAHGVGFVVEIVGVLVKYKVDGEINLGLPEV
jgi:hypothetical protein